MAVMMSSMGASSSAVVSCSLRSSAVPAWLSGPWMNACSQRYALLPYLDGIVAALCIGHC